MRGISPCWLLLLRLLFVARVATANDGWVYQGYIDALSYAARLVVRPESATVQLESRVSFFCRADGNPLPSISWRRNGHVISEARYVVKTVSNGLSTLRIEPVKHADNNTTITCSADNGVGNPVVAEASLTVIPNEDLPAGFPAIDAHPMLKSVERGRTAQVTCQARGEPRPKVMWLRDLMPVDIRANSRYTVSTLGNPGALMIQNSREEDEGKYECIARNEHGVVHSKAAHLYVKVRRVPPHFTIPPLTKYKVGPGGSVNLTCVAVGYPMPRVFWKKSYAAFLEDPSQAPIGKNVLSLTDVDQTENYTCIAVSKLGNVEAIATVEVRALPQAPSGLTVTDVSAHSVSLSWDKLQIPEEPVTGYVIRYRPKRTDTADGRPVTSTYTEGNDYVEQELAADETSAVVSGLESYQQYEFSVLAVNAIGRGAASMPKEAQTSEISPDSPPDRVQARALNLDSILVRWDPPERPNGAILGYKVYYTNLDPSTPYPLWQVQEAESNVQMTTLHKLQSDATYYVRVQARNAMGFSPMSQAATVITKPGIPGQPVNVEAKPIGSKQVELSWEQPLYSSNIVGYAIEFNSSNDPGRELTLTSPITKHIIDSLEPDTAYSFRVAAKSVRGQGAFSPDVTVKTQQSAPTGSPTIDKVLAIGADRLQVTWSAPDKSQQNGRLVSYIVRWTRAKSAEDEEGDDVMGIDVAGRTNGHGGELNRTASDPTEVIISNLNTYTLYRVTVAAGTREGFGPDSEPVEQRTGEDVPSAPREVEVIQVNASTVKVSWQRPAHSNGVLIGYYVYKEQLINGEPVSDQLQRAMVIHDPDKLHALIGGLEPNTEYGFRVNAYNRKGDGEFSSSKKIMTGGLPPSEPQVQSVSLLTQDPPLKALVLWKPPQKTYDMSIIKYIVWYKPIDHIEYSRKDVDGNANQAELDGLLMGRLYEIKVAAENADGLSANATESLNTPVGVPEAAPLNVRYEFDDGKLEISWDPPAIDQRNGNITYYYAVLTTPDGDGPGFTQNVTSGKSTTFMATATKAYSFKVAAATVKGQGPFSTALDINPDPTALVAPPERVRVQATSNSSVVVTWTPTEGEIDGYVVKFIHEPSKQVGSEHHGGGQRQSDSWQERMVPDKAATHVEISGLLSDKPYAFCVLAVRDARQGACSDPPVTIEQLKPLYMVSNLRFVWKTDHSVMLNWEYNGPMPIKFLVSQTGRKNYLDQFLAPKSMVSPSMQFDVDGHERSYKWTSLRPYMEYTFLVGVESIQSGEEYWPKQVTAKTSAAGPPFVDSPEFLDSQTPDRATVKLKMASEEYGPISHYWLIVVPANFSQEDLPRLDNNILRAKSAIDRRRLKRATDEGAYISMELEAAALRKKNQTEHEVVIGDNKEYGDFRNHPLDAKEQYKLMLRAFAVDDDTSKSFDMLVPPQETKGKLWSDSMLSKPFNTKAVVGAGRSTKPGNVWLIGPVIAILIITVIVGMLIIWWMKRNKKKQPHNRHGSITKVALGPNANSETSKLLVGQDVYGRQPMNPYDHMNGNGGLHADPHMEMYPLQQGMGNHYAPVPVPLPVNVPSLPSIGHSLSHPPIPITELATHLDRLKANDCMLFSQEYESIETGQQFTWEHSNMEANKPKNRYANVVAYDHSRVMLTPLDHGQLGADYINANYIDGYRKSKAYIATQGPLPETFADFWRMVWDEQTVTIVMLTKLEERSRIKCDQYWPMRGAHSYGQVQVTLVDTLDLAHYTIRTMRIQRRGEPEVRDIRHLQFTAWPDHGVPDHPTPFLMFLKRVKSLNPPEAGPVTVHCSAGIGRTGAFIAIDCMLERLRYENTVDVFGCVTALRSQRSYMVQTEDQYVFIHDAVLDAVQSGSTEVPAGKLFTHIQALMQVQPLDQASGMELEFRHLAALKMLNCRCSAANLPANKGKNRLVNMVPFDSTRVRLLANPGSGEDGVDYINASWIDGYRQRRSYIATQGPLPNTIDDFWRMLWEHESCIVVMLTKLRELGREKCSQYYPSERSARYGQLVIEPIAEYNMPQYVLREFKMTDTTNGQSRTIRHFQYMDWPEQGSPKSGELFVEFIGQVHKTKEQFGVDGPITVHCSTGAGRTGVFVALSIVLERMRYENVVDIFTTVKLMRTQRQNMVQSEDQYHFCYQAALEYLGSFDMYGVQ